MARTSKAAIEISPQQVKQRGGVVVLSLREYQRLLARAVPTYYLKGKAATKLDRLIETGLDEQKKGKTRVVRSLADLDPRK
jgi:hypothetical protein